jgi:streptomycin 6-kinase
MDRRLLPYPPCSGRRTGMDEPSTGGLAHREAAVVRRWGLRLGPPLAGGYRSHVRDCVTAGGTAVVLKLTKTIDEAWLESRALAGWQGTGATVRLLAADPEQGALLLERLRPGTPLPGGDEPAVLDAAVELLDRLHAVPAPAGFPSVADCFPDRARIARADNRAERADHGDPDRAAGALALMADAQRAMTVLSSTATRAVLLHGDFLDKNLLLNAAHYRAVDPMPYRGEPECEIGFFASHHPPVAGTLHRARTIARRLGADPDRAGRWAAVWTVLLAVSAWRPDQPDLDALVASRPFIEILKR